MNIETQNKSELKINHKINHKINLRHVGSGDKGLKGHKSNPILQHNRFSHYSEDSSVEIVVTVEISHVVGG